MIRKDKNDENYVLVDYTDLLIATSIASKQENKEIYEKLCTLFSDYKEDEQKELNQKDYKKIEANSDIVKFLKEQANIIDYSTYIDKDILKDAFTRAYYEFNYEMKKQLEYYLRKYIDNEINGIDNTYLKEEIVNNKILLEYIKKYDNFTLYVDYKIEKALDMKEKINRIKK